mmetsp:Transcript_16239/g.32911  ORF Transcript_16239/g.32911 Transcript_16239/m.32911 type:complete len:244 (-) Transcript_16239:961-1692(-)
MTTCFLSQSKAISISMAYFALDHSLLSSSFSSSFPSTFPAVTGLAFFCARACFARSLTSASSATKPSESAMARKPIRARAVVSTLYRLLSMYRSTRVGALSMFWVVPRVFGSESMYRFTAVWKINRFGNSEATAPATAAVTASSRAWPSSSARVSLDSFTPLTSASCKLMAPLASHGARPSSRGLSTMLRSISIFSVTSASTPDTEATSHSSGILTVTVFSSSSCIPRIASPMPGMSSTSSAS